jgi:hypothetical protein
MDYPVFESHFRPRSRTGRRFVALFLGLFLLAEPPLVFVLANRIEPFVLGLPFLYAYLSFVYAALILTLLLALRRGL